MHLSTWVLFLFVDIVGVSDIVFDGFAQLVSYESPLPTIISSGQQDGRLKLVRDHDAQFHAGSKGRQIQRRKSRRRIKVAGEED